MWWDLSSKFMVCKIHKLSSISLEFGSLGSLQYALCLCKKQIEWGVSWLVSRPHYNWLIGNISCSGPIFYLECSSLESSIFTFNFYVHLQVSLVPQFKESLLKGKLEAVIQNSVSLVSAETWQRLESVLGMPNLVALGQTLILNAWHTSLCVSIKPCLWIPCKPGNRFYATHVLAFSTS